MLRVRSLALLLCVLAVGPGVRAAEPTAVVLDDFFDPAWGVRWTTLEFSKYTPPQMTRAEGPDGLPAAEVRLPEGGRIVLTTQTEENDKWYGIRGKFPWPISGVPAQIALKVRAAGAQPVRVSVLLHDKAKKEFRSEAVTVAPGEWTDVRFDSPVKEDGARFAGVELSRAGQGGTEPQPVWLADLQALADVGERKLLLSAGRKMRHGHSPIVGEPLEVFARVQVLDPPSRAVSMETGIQRRGEGETPGTEPVQVACRPGRAAIVERQFTPTAPGVYEVIFTATDEQGNSAKTSFDLAVYPPEPMADVEGAEPNRQRLAAAREAAQGFGAYVSNLSPAMLIETEADALQLFAGIDGQGLAVPKYVAVPGQGGVKVYPAEEARFDDMSEPWLVFFAGDAEGWDKITLQSRRKRIEAPIDVPWLAVVPHRPTSLSREPSRLVLSFGQSAGQVALMPLRGLRTFAPAETTAWVNGGLPAAEAEHASAWARRLRRFPLYVKEDFKVDAVNDRVTIRQSFDYLDVGDDWQTPVEKWAPVPPMLKLAQAGGFPVEFQALDGTPAEAVDGGVVTGVGPASGVVGVDGYQYVIGGVLKFINEDRLPLLEGGGDIADRLRGMLAGPPIRDEADTPVSRWSPGLTVREDYGIAMIGNSERQGLLGSTIPYCEADEAAWRKRTLLVDALFLLNPSNHVAQVDRRTGKLYAMEGFAWTRFGRNNWVDNNAYQGEVLHALEFYAKYADDVELLKRHWPFLRAAFGVVSDFKRHGEWELSCFDTGGGDTWDSVYNAAVSFARLADRVGDGLSYRYACYYAAKHMATLPGCRQANQFVAQQPYWASMLQVANFNEAGLITEYDSDLGLKWRHPVAEIEDLTFTDVWGGNYGLRPWNQIVWMRGSRSEYRMAAELAPDYAKYWLTDRVKKFSPEWHQAVLVERRAPGETLDKRTNAPVVPSEGDFSGKINLAARAIVLGDTLEELWTLYGLRGEAVKVHGSEGRVPRLCTPAALLEDGSHQPWVRLFGTSAGATSPDWERGRDAYMDLGDENYLYTLNSREGGLWPQWAVYVAPAARQNLGFGTFGPAAGALSGLRGRGVNWNTTVYGAALNKP